MKSIIIISLLILLTSCGKPKAVLICGDHICLNKKEAEQYFEENLTIEVKIVKKKKDKSIDLIELNLNENQDGKKEINIFAKKKVKDDLRILTKDEKNKIKKNIKKKVKQKKLSGKNFKKKDLYKDNINKPSSQQKERKIDKVVNNRKKVYKKNDNIIDVCTILEKCNIEEISKYLLKLGNDKKFPDITLRQ